jgi:hypothetical protein
VPVSEAEVTSIRQAAASCGVTLIVVRRWLSLGLISAPPWTLHPDPLAGRVRLRRMLGSAERRRQGTLPA